jgi:hypothetical protein
LLNGTSLKELKIVINYGLEKAAWAIWKDCPFFSVCDALTKILPASNTK